MRIGVVTTSYPRVEGEHAGNFVAAHVTALRAAGHEVDVIGAHTIASDLFYGAGAPDELERGGLRAYVAAARFSTRLTIEVARRAHTWDLVIAHWLAPSALAAVLGVLARVPRSPARGPIPILAIAHGGDVHTVRRLQLLAPTLYLLRAANVRLAFVSEELRVLARRAAPRLSTWLDAAIVQPMGIDVEHFASIRAARSQPAPGDETNRPADAPATIVVIARLVPVKGVDVAIRAMQLVRAHARLVIAGDGPERERLAALADRTVTFVGAVDARGRDELLRDAACIVIPSRVLPNGRTEGTPMIALEALAAGVPVIASAVGGLCELPSITRVPPDDPAALAVAIDREAARSVSTASTEGPVARSTSTEPIEATHSVSTPSTRGPADPGSGFDWSHVSDRLLQHALADADLPPDRGSPAASFATSDAPAYAICETGDTSGRRTA